MNKTLLFCLGLFLANHTLNAMNQENKEPKKSPFTSEKKEQANNRQKNAQLPRTPGKDDMRRQDNLHFGN